MKKFLLFISLLLFSSTTYAEDFDIVGTWYQYESDQEGLDGIWVFKADKTGTCEEFHKGVSEGVGNFTYDFNASTNVLTIWNEGEEDDPVVFPIRIDSPTQFTYIEGNESLVWIKQGQPSTDVSHSVAPRAASFKLASSKDGLTYYFTYDNQGRYSDFKVKSGDEAYDVTLSYEEGKILFKYMQFGALVTSEMTLNGDNVVKEVVTISNDNQNVVFNTIDYTYDANDQLVKVVTKSDYEPLANNEINISWEDGNIKSASISGTAINSNLEFNYYTDHEDHSIVNAFSGSVASIFDETESVTFSPMFYSANYFGKSCKNLTKSIKRSGSNSKEGSFDKTIELNYTYESNGLVKECKYGNKVHQYTWENDSRVAPPTLKNHLGDIIFTLDGRRHTTLQKGLNVVRRSDGSVVKVLK
jgi:hypothetical protein